ncbi:MAG TPA: DnaT-like ssDNA-binding protein [Pseudonocardia sp.]|uniref:DnaT-like ssDNA-binding protein n=1 Tax=Pseudonocardia sp. TaxID=60912 RepID=UPI002C8BEA9E|nr:DnaT-like ssDNA-binding protein [Pseudonocardia sp.]HTF53708.1 DnaT-like ssDNA-binding protein [Pseudonocardia sp.]
MALIVEDGSGKPDAESYISTADADAYHLRFGNTGWAAMTTGDKEVCLRRSTAYIDAVFNGKWKGQQSFPGLQGLNWPRRYVVVEGDPPDYWNILTKSPGFIVPDNVVPKAIVDAAAIVGASAFGITDPLLPPIPPTANVKSEKFVVGPIENSVTYADNDGTIRDLTTRFPMLELKLRPYLTTGAGDGAAILLLERA